MQPSIFISGFELAEPVTVLTDVFIGIVCINAYLGLGTFKTVRKEIFYLRVFFATMAFATIYGGIVGHGLMPHLSFAWKLPGWLVSMASIAFLERSAIQYAQGNVSDQWRQFWLGLNIVELCIFIGLVLITLNFTWVEVHAGYGMLVVTGGFFTYAWFTFKRSSSLYFLSAVGVSIVSAVVFSLKLGLGPWFNHLDVSHVLMAGSAWLFYVGGKRILEEN